MISKFKIISLFFLLILVLSGCKSEDKETKEAKDPIDSKGSVLDTVNNVDNSINKEQLEESRDILLPKEHISLTVGIKERLVVADGEVVVEWSSNNPAVTVDSKGYIYAKDDKRGDDAKAIITATLDDGSRLTCNITIVSWRANLSKLTLISNPKDGELIGKKDDGTLLLSAGPNLYASTDGMKNFTRVGDFPSAMEQTPILLKTPYKYYLRSDAKIFDSSDMVNYSEILTQTAQGRATDHPGLNHAFAYDPIGEYIYAGEYTINRNNRHSVWRGKVGYLGITNWKKVLEFDPYVDQDTMSVFHIHAVVVDPYSGAVWVGTGDSDSHSRLYYSDDHGESFKLFAIGSQKYRILAMWFTKDYIYWNTDSDYEDQLISRVKRSDHKDRGELTPRLSSGTTKVGVKYYVYKNSGNLPVDEGRVYVETQVRDLSQNSIVYAVDDPEYDYRQTVANLSNGSHWFYSWVKDSRGEDLVIMSAAAEGEKRDKRARLFGIKELKGGDVDVQELFSIAPGTDRETSHYVQLTPGYQDDDGYIYFRGRETEHMIYKMKLDWVDQAKGGK